MKARWRWAVVAVVLVAAGLAYPGEMCELYSREVVTLVVESFEIDGVSFDGGYEGRGSQGYSVSATSGGSGGAPVLRAFDPDRSYSPEDYRLERAP